MTGFLIAGTSSGVGKTTATLAIAAALRRRGRTVQLFKGGPDFLDTGHHSRISGRKSRNLDTWMLDHRTNAGILNRAAKDADVVVVEGMMGLFDGKSGSEEHGSSAEIAKLLKLPVVLVLDAGKSARSVGAMVLGFELFDPDLQLAGVILNRVASERHYQMLKSAIDSRCSTPVIGWLPRESAISIPERHLGLQTAQEAGDDLEQQMELLGTIAESHLAVDRLLSLHCGFAFEPLPVAEKKAAPAIRVGVAYDAAFSFYYEDNLELLRDQGAELVFFSPLVDRSLPPRIDALYLGGGYPELYAGRLSANAAMLDSIRRFAESLRPVYAECGGMMYLMNSLKTSDGKTHAMAGIFNSDVEMTDRLRRFGYVEVTFTRDCILGCKGVTIRGHSFHYSRIIATDHLSSNYQVCYSLSGKSESEGFTTGNNNVLASYVHLHFRSHPAVAEHFIKAAVAGR